MIVLTLLADHDRTRHHADGTADILPTRQRKPSLRRVSFEFYAPAAREVFLAGEFNDWDATSMPLHFSADGHWRIEVMLPAGIYRHKSIPSGVAAPSSRTTAAIVRARPVHGASPICSAPSTGS